MLLIYLSLAWLIGLVIADTIQISFWWWVALGVAGVVSALVSGQ